MKIIEQQQVHQSLDFIGLIDALRHGFSGNFGMPQRQVFALDEQSDNNNAFAVLPAWNDEVIGVKSFTYFPDNGAQGYESLYSKIMLFSRQHGQPLALVDGTSITLWRTAAVSALASRYLSREDSRRMVFFGSGNLASYMISAHLSVRQLSEVIIVGRNIDKVNALIDDIKTRHPQVTFKTSTALEQEIGDADIVSCATGSPTPLFPGRWLSAGTHVDLIGNHHHDCRECDSDTIVNSDVYVDRRTNVLNEAGELLIPIQQGRFAKEDIKAQLSELCSAKHQGRDNNECITVFKSVGTALSDLIAAHLVYRQLID